MLPLTFLLQAGLSIGTMGKAIGAGFAAFAAAFGIGKIGSASLEAGALIEGACLFAIVVCLIAK